MGIKLYEWLAFENIQSLHVNFGTNPDRIIAAVMLYGLLRPSSQRLWWRALSSGKYYYTTRPCDTNCLKSLSGLPYTIKYSCPW